MLYLWSTYCTLSNLNGFYQKLISWVFDLSRELIAWFNSLVNRTTKSFGKFITTRDDRYNNETGLNFVNNLAFDYDISSLSKILRMSNKCRINVCLTRLHINNFTLLKIPHSMQLLMLILNLRLTWIVNCEIWEQMVKHYKIYTAKYVKKQYFFVLRPIFIGNVSPIKCYLYRSIERKLLYRTVYLTFCRNSIFEWNDRRTFSHFLDIQRKNGHWDSSKNNWNVT